MLCEFHLLIAKDKRSGALHFRHEYSVIWAALAFCDGVVNKLASEGEKKETQKTYLSCLKDKKDDIIDVERNSFLYRVRAYKSGAGVPGFQGAPQARASLFMIPVLHVILPYIQTYYHSLPYDVVMISASRNSIRAKVQTV